jgi:alpha-tubulin suppressor-like RCC1 family protein
VSSGVIMADGGEDHSCLLDVTQNVKCVGRVRDGQVGNGNSAGFGSEQSFTTVSNLDPASTISVGHSHSCAMLISDASIACWGQGSYGKLGTAGTGEESVPVLATQFNTGSANVQVVVGFHTTYVNIELLSP